MPSEKALQAKQEAVAQLKSKLDGAVAGVLVDYRGITVADDTKLRRELREAGIDYSVSKTLCCVVRWRGLNTARWFRFLRIQPRSQ